MARPCDCDGPCLSGRYGAYTVLVHLAQADTDPARRQQAMAHLSTIGPMAGSLGADGSCPGDGPAAPMLARLYPQPPAGPDPLAAIRAEMQARIAQIEQEALAAFRQLIGHIAAGQAGD